MSHEFSEEFLEHLRSRILSLEIRYYACYSFVELCILQFAIILDVIWAIGRCKDGLVVLPHLGQNVNSGLQDGRNLVGSLFKVLNL